MGFTPAHEPPFHLSHELCSVTVLSDQSQANHRHNQRFFFSKNSIETYGCTAVLRQNAFNTFGAKIFIL